ncbi:MAG: TM1266 family iron-only hydrogenase system putative regulator [Lachnospiraceae bacterium]
MENRVAIIGIVVEDLQQTERMNAILHEYKEYIIGRMGLPYEKKQISLISVMVDGPQTQISAMSGKLGALTGMSVKTIYSKI